MLKTCCELAILISMKVLLFIGYVVVTLVSAFTLIMSNEFYLSDSAYWSQFLFPLLGLFCVAAVISLFLPLKFSYIPPLLIAILFVLVFVLTDQEIKAVRQAEHAVYETSVLADKYKFE